MALPTHIRTLRPPPNWSHPICVHSPSLGNMLAGSELDKRHYPPGVARPKFSPATHSAGGRQLGSQFAFALKGRGW